jgi:ABC-type phosphate transport system auxiliary subunit
MTSLLAITTKAELIEPLEEFKRRKLLERTKINENLSKSIGKYSKEFIRCESEKTARLELKIKQKDMCNMKLYARIEQLENEKSALKKKYSKLKTEFKRITAEFENTKNRTRLI